MKSRQFIKFIVAGGVAAIANFGSRILLSYWLPYIPSIIMAFCEQFEKPVLNSPHAD